jgi:molybdopterin-guanine dinucleotide biosynthesis protein A
VVEVLKELHAEAITPDEMATAGLSEAQFVNVNTPEEWTQLAQVWGGRR